MYTIKWARSAYDELARVWTAADSPERARITQAVAVLEDRLSHDPLSLGESRQESARRVVHEPPIGFDVFVDDTRRIVRVIRVWVF